MIKNINAANDDNNDTVNDEGAATDNNDSDDISKRSCAPSVSSTRKECHLDDIIDSSGDPSPQPLNRLSVSLQSLLFTDRNTNNDCGLSRNTAINTSTSTLNDLQRPSVITLEDDFFDMLTRMQSKRINEQRCDPNILTDLTNRSKGIARQSDSLVCDGAEDMLDLIESLQGRRMEEQRAHLSVNAESVSVSESGTDEPKETSDEIRKSERSKSEDAHSLYEMLLRSQSDRINEQRSELPNTIPDEDISQIVITMQKGRIETQRAQLKPTSE